MKMPLVLLLTAFGVSIGFAADPKSEVVKAARALAAKPNYRWTTSSKAEGNTPNWRTGPVEGKTENNGFTYFSGSLGDSKYEYAAKGDKKAFKVDDDEWETLQSLETSTPWIARRVAAFKSPAAEAEELAGKTKGLKKGEDGSYSGDLTEQAIKDMFSRSSRSSSPPQGGKGWLKFWIKDGVLSKYEYNVQGKVTLSQDNKPVEINRTTTVEIKDVGKTKVELSEDAKKTVS